ncbi:MAG: tetratricopeptide repeat protein [Alphaproteobacteria bacterium]|nr:tetratricopeptide repeat protein [Alphaproteobacteria bacterium]
MILGRPRPLVLAAALLLSGLIAGGPAAARARWQLGPVQIATIDGEVAIAKKQYRSRQYLAARATARIVLRRRPDNIGALSFLGWSEYQLGNYRASSRAFSAILRWQPNSPDALIGLGWCNFKLGRLMQSEKNFIAARPLTVGDQRYVVADGLGWIAFARGKLDRAELQFRSQAEQRRKGRIQHDGDLGLAWIAMRRGRFAQATALLDKGLRESPDYFRLHDARGRAALLQGDYKGAVAHALMGLKYVRYNSELYYLLDAAMQQQGDPAKALATYRALIRAYPDIPAYYNGLAWVELRRKRWRKAEASFLIALQMQRNNAVARFGLRQTVARMNAVAIDAWKLYEGGDYGPALAGFNKLLGPVARTNPAIQTGRGWSLLALGRAKPAAAAFTAALKIDPNFASAKRGLAAAKYGYRTAYLLAWDLAEAKRFLKARAQFVRARAVAPKSEQWRIDEGLAWLDLFEGRTAKAEIVFRRIIEANATADISRKGLGYAAIERKQYSKAMEHLKASYAIRKRQTVTSFTIPADRLNDAGRYKMAREIVEAGARIHGQNGAILFQLARAYAGLGDSRRAAILAKRAAGSAPVAIDPVFDKLKLPAVLMTPVRRRLAWGLYFARASKQAAKRFSAIVIATDGGLEAIRGRGFARYRLQKYAGAIADLRLAATSEPGRLKPVREIVPIPGTGRYWPIRYNASSTLAWAHFRRGNMRLAAAQFRAVLKIYPSWIDALTGLGYSLHKLGDRAGALSSFRQALLISPGYPDAWQGILRMGAER